jgi:Ser/Thr protein kinase RdoA (MazF antagonist)
MSSPALANRRPGTERFHPSARLAHTGKVIGGSGEWPPGELRRVLREQAGLDVVAVRAAGAGESQRAFWVTDRAGTVSVLKILPEAPQEAAGHLRELDAVLARLRDRGYPAPRFRIIGQLPGLVFWVQPRLPGAALDRGRPEPDHAALARLLPELLRLNDAQAGLGTGPPGWRRLITQTLTAGGDGYCLHTTLQASAAARDLLPVLRRIGERCGPAIPDGQDFVHYDFTPANLLSDGTAITGVIDINPPVLAGDRAFDLATLLFYHYDHDQIRGRLRARLLELAGPSAARAYLAHMVLRQVDWSLRHHPAAAATRRYLRLATAITADIDRSPAR